MLSNKTVDDLSKKADQRKARSAAAWAYSGTPETFRDICEAYKNPSAAKVAAWDYCKRLCESFGGYDLIICGKNCMKFSALFRYVEQTTGALCYAYITPKYARYCYA